MGKPIKSAACGGSKQNLTIPLTAGEDNVAVCNKCPPFWFYK
jgi:hypothetical protein